MKSDGLRRAVYQFKPPQARGWPRYQSHPQPGIPLIRDFTRSLYQIGVFIATETLAPGCAMFHGSRRISLTVGQGVYLSLRYYARVIVVPTRKARSSRVRDAQTRHPDVSFVSTR